MDKRKFLDAALIILFLLTMSFYFFPRILHEISGLMVAAGVVVAKVDTYAVDSAELLKTLDF